MVASMKEAEFRMIVRAYLTDIATIRFEEIGSVRQLGSLNAVSMQKPEKIGRSICNLCRYTAAHGLKCARV
jgi:hypothetical protein